MAITSQVWNGKAFVNTDSDTVDQKNVNDGAASSSTLWTSSKVSEELTKKAEKTHTHSASQVSGLHAVATNGNYESLINKPTIPPAYTHPNDSNTRHVTDAEKATWNGKANANHTHDYAPTNHSHSEYAAASHSHSNYAPTSHTHTIANISGLQGEIDNLKQSVSSGKNAIASAITGKGVAASGSDTFATLSNKISQISSATPIRISSQTSSITLSSTGRMSGHVEDLPNINSIYKFCKMTIQITTTGTAEIFVSGIDHSTIIFQQTIGAGSHSLIYCFNSQNRPYDGYVSGGFVIANRHGSDIDISYSFHYSYIDLSNIL